MAICNMTPTYKLGNTVRRTGVERRLLALGRLDNLTVQLGRRSLVEPDVLFQTGSTDRVEDTERAETVDVASVFRHFKRDLDVGLVAEVVDLGGLDLGDDVGHVGGVGQVTVVEDHLGLCQISTALHCSATLMPSSGQERGTRRLRGREGGGVPSART